MISIYIHIPFCEKKCSYCNFLVNPLENIEQKDVMISNYVEGIKLQIKNRSSRLQDKSIKTLYFGGGTPLSIGKDNIIAIIKFANSLLDLTELEELSFELNPTPGHEVIDFISTINSTFKNLYRIRYSIGLQAFDDKVLKDAGREYYFNYLVGFLRDLTPLKGPNNIFNFDFIAFGKFNQDKKGNKILRDQTRVNFFYDFVTSQFADSLSLYTLELFPGSLRYSKHKDEINQDDIYEEFSYLKSIMFEGGYKRYELSNFSFGGKSSIHNRVYWKMQPYIGIGLGASSFINKEYLGTLKDINSVDQNCGGVRFENTKSLDEFINGKYIDEKSIINLDERDLLVEEFFLGLRTDSGIKNLDRFQTILVKDYETKINEFQNDGLIVFSGDVLTLTDKGMDLYNSVITDLVEKF